jgi:hypothetical protein
MWDARKGLERTNNKMRYLRLALLLLVSATGALANNNFAQANIFSGVIPGNGVPLTASYANEVSNYPSDKAMCFVSADFTGFNLHAIMWDDQNNTWIKVQDVTNGWHTFVSWYALACHGTIRVFFHCNEGGGGTVQGVLAEYHGVVSFDTAQTRTRDSAAYAVEAPRTSVPNELLLFWGGNIRVSASTNSVTLIFHPDDEITERGDNGNFFFGDSIVAVPNGLYAAIVFVALPVTNQPVSVNWTAGTATFFVVQ